MTLSTSAPATEKHTLEGFRQRIHKEFTEGSAIAPELFSANVQIVSDVETGPGGEVSTPIHDALNWTFTRFGQQVKASVYAALILNEAGETWQAKLSHPRQDSDGRTMKYEFPRGGTSKPYLPNIPASIRQRIGDRYKVKVPLEGSFWEWLESHPELPIIITEGAKKALSLLSLGYVAISLLGITGAVRVPKNERGEKLGKPYLLPEVARFLTKGREVFVCFDQDSKPKTVQSVNFEISKLGRLSKARGCEVKVLSWHPSLGKGVDDLIASHGALKFEEISLKAIAFKDWQAKSLNALTYVSKTLNRAFLGEVEIPETAKLIGIRSRKGSGKTESLVEIVKCNKANGKRTIVIVHRIQLCEALGKRLGLLTAYDLKRAQDLTKDESIEIWLRAKQEGFVLCVDSMHSSSQIQFDADEWMGCDVVIDEVEQVIWHLLNSSTLNSGGSSPKSRIAVLREFRKLLAYALHPKSEGRVFLCDADLTNVSIDFIKGFGGGAGIEPYVINNEWKPASDQGWKVTLYETDFYLVGEMGFDSNGSQEWLYELEKEIERGGKVFVFVESQRRKGRLSTSNLERRWRSQYPGKKILRIDSESLRQQDHPAFGCMGNLDEVLKQYDIVIASPSLQTGVSIDLKGHFSSVWGLFYGVAGEASARQALARVRETVPRHIWIETRGLGSIARGETSVKELMANESNLIKTNLHLLHSACVDDEEEEGVDLESLAIAHQTWAKMAVRINAGLKHFKDAVVAGLREEGHSVTPYESMESLGSTLFSIQKSLSSDRDAHQQEYGDRLASARLLDESEYQSLKEEQSLASEEQAVELDKRKLHDRYGGTEVTPDLYLRDCDRWYPELQWHYFLTEGRQYLEERDRSKLKGLTYKPQTPQRMGFMPDLNRSLMITGIKVLEALGIPELLQKERWIETDPDIEAFAQKARQKNVITSIYRALGVRLNPTRTAKREGKEEERDATGIELARPILRKLGINLHGVGKVGGRGKQKRIYTLKACYTNDPEDNPNMNLDDGRFEIFQRWTAAYEERRAEQAAAEAEKANKLSPSENTPVGIPKMYQLDTVSNFANRSIFPVLDTEKRKQDSPMTKTGNEPEQAALPPTSSPAVEATWQDNRSRLAEGARVQYLNLEWKVEAVGSATASLITDRGFRTNCAPINELIPLTA